MTSCDDCLEVRGLIVDFLEVVDIFSVIIRCTAGIREVSVRYTMTSVPQTSHGC